MKLKKFFTALAIILISLNLQAQNDDLNANAFISAAGITDTTQMTAITTFVKGIKNAGLWTKMKVIYPFVGGNSTSHKYNLKDPSIYIITWGGTITHDANGITGNGTSGYGDTHFTLNNLYYREPSNPNAADMSWGWTIYNRSNNAQTGIDLGNADYDAGSMYENISQNFSAKSSNCTALNGNPADSRGLYVWINQCADQLTEYKNVYRNGNLLVTGIVGSNGSEVTWNTNPNVSVGILGLHVGWSNEFNSFSSNNLSLVAMHKALTESERALWEAAVNNFECALSRSNETCNNGAGGNTTTTSSSQWITSGNNIYNSNTGNVGIGTGNAHINSSGYKLWVDGTIRARKLKVDIDTWPDYVFDKNYKLPSLSETEKFINFNQHLPGIPSAKEVQKYGIDLGDNQALLLAKIEELTLIAIDQNKEINKLKTQVKSFLSNKKIIRNDKKQ